MQEIKPARKKLAKLLVFLKFDAVFLSLTAYGQRQGLSGIMLVLKKIGQVKAKNGLFQEQLK